MGIMDKKGANYAPIKVQQKLRRKENLLIL